MGIGILRWRVVRQGRELDHVAHRLLISAPQPVVAAGSEHDRLLVILRFGLDLRAAPSHMSLDDPVACGFGDFGSHTRLVVRKRVGFKDVLTVETVGD